MSSSRKISGRRAGTGAWDDSSAGLTHVDRKLRMMRETQGGGFVVGRARKDADVRPSSAHGNTRGGVEIRPLSAHAGKRKSSGEVSDARFQANNRRSAGKTRPASAYMYPKFRAGGARVGSNNSSSNNNNNKYSARDRYCMVDNYYQSKSKFMVKVGDGGRVQGGAQQTKNQKLMEKNDMLRRELVRLQRNRHHREQQRKDTLRSEPPHVIGEGVQGNEKKASTLHLSSVDSDNVSEGADESQKIAAGSGIQAVRASTSQSSSAHNSKVDVKPEDSIKNSIKTKEKELTKKVPEKRTETTKKKISIIPDKTKTSTPYVRPTSAGLRVPISHDYGKSAKPSENKSSSSRPSSAHPRRKSDAVPHYSGTSKVHSRPQSAHTRTSSSSANTKSAAVSQHAERERLQKLVSSNTWEGVGQPDMYVFGKLLGQGSFGTVRLAHHKITGHKVAIKSYERSRFKDAAQLKRCRQEIQLMETLNHIHIARLFETFETPQRIHLVMEAASGGNLCSYVKSRKRLPETEAVRIFYHVLVALEYLHSQGIVHRDVKLENVLFDSNRVIKLVDFGFSVKAHDKKLRVFCGTPSYMAPEIVRRKEYHGYPVDVWSLGVLLYAMLCGRFPFTAKTYPDLYKKISRGQYQIPETISANVRDVVRRMLCLNPAMRITIAQMKHHVVLTERAESFPKVPSPNKCTHLTSDDANDDIQPGLIKQLVDFGFPKQKLLRSIKEKKRNHLTATFYLLAMKAERKKLVAERQKQKGKLQQQLDPKPLGGRQKTIPQSSIPQDEEAKCDY